MVAAIQSGRLIDGTDEGLLRGEVVIYQGYVPGELLPPDVLTIDAPTVTLVSPAAGSVLRAGDAAVYLVTSTAPIFLHAFRVRIGTQLPLDEQTREAAYDRDDPSGAWDARYAGSSVEQLSATQWRITLRRKTWPAGGIGILPLVSNGGGAAT